MNQISTYRPLAAVFSRNCTVPPTSDALAATGSWAGSDRFPTRTWTSAPTGVPRASRTRVTFTASPMSSSSPVPGLSWPNSGVAYQLVCHACPSPLMIPAARPGWSPSDVPSGPAAAADAIVSRRTAIAPETGPRAEDAAGAGLAAATAAGRGAAWTAVRGAEWRPTASTTVKIRSPTASAAMSATTATRPAVRSRSALARVARLAGFPSGLARLADLAGSPSALSFA